MATLLITGGTGLIGKALTKKLLKQGHNVRILSRTPSPNSKIPSFFWNVESQEMDDKAFDGIDHLVHLAGIGVADKRWTDKRKQEIIDSRVNSMKLISDTVKQKGIQLKSFVGASAIGIYGMETSDTVFSEEDKGSKDFLSETCELWEKSYTDISILANKTAILRIGVVLSKQGGALERLIPLFKKGLGSAIGNGKQYMPWIHIDDMVSVIMEGLFNEQFKGIYNAVAPEHITNATFSKQLAQVLSKPFFMPNVPAFAMKLVFGEMANVLLSGSRASNKKLLESGFEFKYPTLNEALKQIIS
ncbi:MAG: TIGR01777 family oxidoreductase [Bacteroidota bacterium]